MALYVALSFWLAVIIFSAWGVYHLWTALVKPRVVNFVLLPGTLVAEIGHVLGLLLSGSPVQYTTLWGDDDKGNPKSDAPDQHRIPVVGPILVGLLPLVACAACLYLAARTWGAGILGDEGLAIVQVPQTLPTTLAGFWDLLRGCINLLEAMVNAICHSDLPSWPTALFLYLAICLTVRMAPLAGNQRGALGAIVLAALAIAVLASLFDSVRVFFERTSWPVLSFAVGMLLFLLVVSLLIRGVVGFLKVLAQKR